MTAIVTHLQLGLYLLAGSCHHRCRCCCRRRRGRRCDRCHGDIRDLAAAAHQRSVVWQGLQAQLAGLQGTHTSGEGHQAERRDGSMIGLTLHRPGCA